MKNFDFKKQHILFLTEWIGAATGVTGAFLVSLNTTYSKYGYFSFLISNISFIIFSLLDKKRGLLVMQVIYLLIAIVGIYQWFKTG